MIALNQELALRFEDLYSRCHNSDVSNADRHSNGKYSAPFETYKQEYAPLKNLDVVIANLLDAGYFFGREGNCDSFLAALLGIKEFPQEAFSILTSFPGINTSEEGSLVAYCSSHPSYGAVRTHVGLVRNGKVLSKFGDGPIFLHEILQVPYFVQGNEVKNFVRFFRV